VFIRGRMNLSGSGSLPFRKMRVRHSNQFQCVFQVGLGIYHECDVAGFRRPAVTARFAMFKDSLLVIGTQSNIAMTASMDVHEHGSSNKECVFVNAGVWPFGDARQRKNPLA